MGPCAWHGRQSPRATIFSLSFHFLLKAGFFKNIYLPLRDREEECEKGRGREREGDTESEAGSRLRAVSTEPDAELELTNCKIMTWAKVGCSTNWASQRPLSFHFLNFLLVVCSWQPLLGSEPGLSCSSCSWSCGCPFFFLVASQGFACFVYLFLFVCFSFLSRLTWDDHVFYFLRGSLKLTPRSILL